MNLNEAWARLKVYLGGVNSHKIKGTSDQQWSTGARSQLNWRTRIHTRAFLHHGYQVARRSSLSVLIRART